MKYVTVDEYCVHLSDVIKSNLRASDYEGENFKWWADALSDHMPIGYDILLPPSANATAKMVHVITWNVLNKKYLKHMQPTEKNDNQRLGHHDMANMDPAAQAAREWQVSARIQSMLSSRPGAIMCLQEVSGSLLEILKRTMGKKYTIQVTRISREKEGNGVSNCNVIMAATDVYDFVDRRVLIPAEHEKEACEYSILSTYKDNVMFNVASVHLAWSTKVNHAELFLDISTSYPTIIAGDFNRGVRYPIAPDGMHMRYYHDARFKFPDPEGDRSYTPHSHVCHFANVGSADRMLERFDHVMMIEPKRTQ